MSVVRRDGVHLSTKVFDNVYTTFRIWNAENPKDAVLKAYNFKIKVLFESHFLDQSNQLLPDDHDCFNEFNKMLDQYFRNKTIVDHIDPEISIMQALDQKGIISISTLPDVSPERIAQEIFNWFKVWLTNSTLINRVDVRSVELVTNDRHSVMYVE